MGSAAPAAPATALQASPALTLPNPSCLRSCLLSKEARRCSGAAAGAALLSPSASQLLRLLLQWLLILLLPLAVALVRLLQGFAAVLMLSDVPVVGDDVPPNRRVTSAL